uniref:Uncharacterized protein n=1 Tax=Rangifer tarandus platyrhynchus TaxID=3082113 RepID=A0ACB0EXU0_RANTA|nr:unnamed protein product [Rangifer tarandus platyrhynchus]
MSLEKGALFGYPLGDRREWRGKPQRAARGRDKARCQGARGQARTFGLSQLEPGSRGAQTMREKLWMPWNGLIVIGRKMELLGRKTRRPKTWDPKLESENWRLEDVEKTVLRGKSGRSPERMDVKRVRSVSSALQISAGLRKDSSKEVWGKQEFRHTVEAESESAGAAVGSRKGPAFKEKLKFTDVETSGEDLRSRGYEVKQNEEELRGQSRIWLEEGVHARAGPAPDFQERTLLGWPRSRLAGPPWVLPSCPVPAHRLTKTPDPASPQHPRAFSYTVMCASVFS